MTQDFEQIPEPDESRIENSISDQNNSMDNKNWAATRFGRATAGTLVGLVVSPANELVRLSLYGVAQEYTHSPIISALTLGVSTFAVEGVGSYATADLMDADMENNRIQKIHNRIKKSRIMSKINTGVGTEMGLSMFMGVPATMVIKQAQLPERTREENRNYGLRMSLGVAAVLGTEALTLSETISHPSLKNGLILAGAVGVAAGGVGRVMKRVTSKKQAKSQKNQNSGEL